VFRFGPEVACWTYRTARWTGVGGEVSATNFDGSGFWEFDPAINPPSPDPSCTW
jgi:hypothetical protein